MLREEGDQKVDECTFEVNEVYAVDVAMTTGEGKPREQDSRTTVFKRNVDKNYSLKMKAARAMFSEINKKFPTLPFTIR
ncbi:EBP1 [Symbiodinium microadriaticum]|nr:EBP1 [Symbiodinium microadriaticum]